MPHVVVPITTLDGAARQALTHAHSFVRNGTPVLAIHLARDRASAAELRRQWERGAPEANLVILEAAAESAALLAYLDLLQASDEVTVVLPAAPTLAAATLATLQDRPGVVVLNASNGV